MKKRGHERGQVVIEYVILLIISVLLVLLFIALTNAFTVNGRRLITLVSFDIP